MKHLLALTLVATLGFAVVGCNKTSKVKASVTDGQATSCPMAAEKACCGSCGGDAAAKATQAKPAAAGKSECCASKAKAKPAAAGEAKDCQPADCQPADCSSKAKAKPAAAGEAKDCHPADCSSKGKKSSGCPMSGGW